MAAPCCLTCSGFGVRASKQRAEHGHACERDGECRLEDRVDAGDAGEVGDVRVVECRDCVDAEGTENAGTIFQAGQWLGLVGMDFVRLEELT